MIRSSEWVRSRHRVRSHYRCRIVRDDQGVLDDRQESHLADTVGADERVLIIRRILERLSLEIATPNEAREMLALKGADQVAF
jgi:hypothetical protein